MPLHALAFLCGILLLQQFSRLPALVWGWGIAGVVFLLYMFFKKHAKYFRLPAMAGLGFAYALWYASMQLSWTLPAKVEGKVVTVTGTIASIPAVSPHRTAFLFALDTLESNRQQWRAHGFAQLSWQHSPKISAGDHWQLSVRLKKIHALMNPGGTDYEAWALQKGVRAAGYVLAQTGNKLLGSPWCSYPVDRVREFFKDQIEKNLKKTPTSPWITALAVGERQNISPYAWEVLRKTGTNHLMAIAGLHIGCMAALIYAVVTWTWRRMPALILKMPAQHAGAIGALVMAMVYSAMSGFSVPAERACVMLLAALAALLLRRRVSLWQAWGSALFFVLLLNPLSVLSESVWLSFGSVAWIIYGMQGRLAPEGAWWKYGRIQWVISLGLVPLGIWLFHECSIVSFIANSLAIPCVGLLIVPLTLAGCFSLIFSAKIGSILLWLADKSLAILWAVLSQLAHLSWAAWYQAIPAIWPVIAGCIGMVILLLPRGLPGRWLGTLWLLSLVLYRPATPVSGEVWFTLLDVGQGLSAIVQTQNHTLVFDAGPRLNENDDRGESVVLPFLRAAGVHHVDRLVISHGDNDHIGGAAAIIEKVPVYLVKTSVPERFSQIPAAYCLKGERWQWDGVEFEFLYPPPDRLGLDNDSSCVLRVSARGKHLLLTGDIEKSAEEYLVSHSASQLAADILVAPHHGSQTSAVDEFIHAVNPHIVLFPVGYLNRYHFPHPRVVEKYQRLDIAAYDTVHAGAIQFRWGGGSEQLPFLYRSIHNRYWSL